jgi:hypothetical protein
MEKGCSGAQITGLRNVIHARGLLLSHIYHNYTHRSGSRIQVLCAAFYVRSQFRAFAIKMALFVPLQRDRTEKELPLSSALSHNRVLLRMSEMWQAGAEIVQWV